MSRFDVGMYAIRRRGRRRPFEVRWRAAGRARSRSFLTRALAESYRAELVRAARLGLEFDPATGEPVLWAGPGPVAVTWYQHAVAYAAMKWPSLAAHSRASLAEALATVTPALTGPAPGRPPAAALRAALYGYAFNPARAAAADEATARVLAWAEKASLPVTRLADPLVLRPALDALTLRLDGRRAAANTITRKRAVFHGALGYAVETGLLESNPAGRISWRAPQATPAVDPAIVASPAQAQALLGAVARIRPELAAFFGCLYYAALRPEEAIALRSCDCRLPGHGWGMLTLTATCPRTAAAWTGDGSSHEQRGLKHRPDGAVRMVPVPPVLAAMLRAHYRCHGTAPDGRLFGGTRGGPLSESVYGRAWHAARALALGPELAATGLARRPYDLRHAALSLWLSAGAPPAEVAARAGHSVTVLLSVYVHCIDGHDRITNRLIEDALSPGSSAPCQKASGSADRRYPPRRCPLYVRERPPRPGHGPQSPSLPSPDRRIPPPHPSVVSPVQTAYESLAPGGCGAPDLAHAWPTNQSKRSAEPLALHVKAGDAIPRHRL